MYGIGLVLRLLVLVLRVVIAHLIQSKGARATKNELHVAMEDRICSRGTYGLWVLVSAEAIHDL